MLGPGGLGRGAIPGVLPAGERVRISEVQRQPLGFGRPVVLGYPPSLTLRPPSGTNFWKVSTVVLFLCLVAFAGYSLSQGRLRLHLQGASPGDKASLTSPNAGGEPQPEPTEAEESQKSRRKKSGGHPKGSCEEKQEKASDGEARGDEAAPLSSRTLPSVLPPPSERKAVSDGGKARPTEPSTARRGSLDPGSIGTGEKPPTPEKPQWAAPAPVVENLPGTTAFGPGGEVITDTAPPLETAQMHSTGGKGEEVATREGDAEAADAANSKVRSVRELVKALEKTVGVIGKLSGTSSRWGSSDASLRQQESGSSWQGSRASLASAEADAPPPAAQSQQPEDPSPQPEPSDPQAEAGAAVAFSPAELGKEIFRTLKTLYPVKAEDGIKLVRISSSDDLLSSSSPPVAKTPGAMPDTQGEFEEKPQKPEYPMYPMQPVKPMQPLENPHAASSVEYASHPGKPPQPTESIQATPPLSRHSSGDDLRRQPQPESTRPKKKGKGLLKSIFRIQKKGDPVSTVPQRNGEKVKGTPASGEKKQEEPVSRTGAGTGGAEEQTTGQPGEPGGGAATPSKGSHSSKSIKHIVRKVSSWSFILTKGRPKAGNSKGSHLPEEKKSPGAAGVDPEAPSTAPHTPAAGYPTEPQSQARGSRRGQSMYGRGIDWTERPAQKRMSSLADVSAQTSSGSTSSLSSGSRVRVEGGAKALGEWYKYMGKAEEIIGHQIEKRLRPVRQLDSTQDNIDARTALRSIMSEQSKEIRGLFWRFSKDQKLRAHEAIQILEQFGTDDAPKTFYVENIYFCSDRSSTNFGSAFMWKRIVMVSNVAVTFEVEALEKEIKDVVGEGPLAMKLHLLLEEEGATEEDRDAMFYECEQCVYREAEVLEQVMQPGETPRQAMARSGLAMPFFVGTLGDTESRGQTKHAIFHKGVLFSPLMQGDFSTVLTLQEEKPPVPMSVKISVLKRVLLSLGHLHGAGLVSNDIRPDGIHIDAEGRAFIGNFGGAEGTEEERQVWSSFNLAPENVRELGNHWVQGTEKADSYGAGVTAFLILMDPLTLEHLQNFLPVLSASKTDLVRGIFDYNSLPSPAAALLEANVPEEWVTIVSSLMQPDPSVRPTVRQVLAAFSRLFQ